jgi:hypothetical protein
VKAEYSIPIMTKDRGIRTVRLRPGAFDRKRAIEIEIPNGVGKTVQLPADLFAPHIAEMLAKI